jgi:hypothetical protein
MKLLNFVFITLAITITAGTAIAQTKNTGSRNKKLYIDVHHLEAGKVSFADVAAAHAKDLAVQKKYSTEFINTGWIQQKAMCIACLHLHPLNPLKKHMQKPTGGCRTRYTW